MALDRVDDTTYNPEYDQAKGVDEQIQRLAGASGAVVDVTNVGSYLQRSRDYGLNMGDYQGIYDEAERAGGLDLTFSDPNRVNPGDLESMNPRLSDPRFHDLGSKLWNRLHNSNDQAKLKQLYVSNVDAKIRELNQQKLDLLGQARNRNIERAKNKETQISSSLDGLKTDMNAAIDTHLSNLLSQVGYRADVARQSTGADYAGRGLLRSTGAGKALQDVTTGELEQKAQTRGTAEQQKLGVDSGVESVKTSIAQKRQQMEQQNSLAEIQAAQDVGYVFDQKSIEDRFSQDMLQMQLDADSKSFLTGLIGKTIGGIAKLFVKGR